MASKQSLPDDPLVLGIPADLVFDDEPLEPMLYGTEPIAPTPASVIEIWQKGLDRSVAAARALAAVLVQNPDSISRIGDLDSAEQCLRAAIESKPSVEGAKLASSFSGLARVMELMNRMDEAESFYRQALELQEKTHGIGHEVTFTTGMRLVNLLETSNRKDEAVQLRNRLQAHSLTNKENDLDLLRLRTVALDMFLAGQYDEAEAVYRRLVEKQFELGSTHCHLARLYLMTDREEDARREVDRAWDVRHLSPAYVLVRIHFLKTLLQMLAGGEWEPCLKEIKSALAHPGVHMDWTIQPVLDQLKGRRQKAECRSEHWELLAAVAAAVSDSSKLAELESNPNWKAICSSNESNPATATSDASSPVPQPQASVTTPAPEPGDNDKFTFGTIVEVSGDCITLKEYDFAHDTDVKNEYHVNDQTEYGNVSKLAELFTGDSVVVDYIESGGRRIILVLVKEERDETPGTITRTE